MASIHQRGDRWRVQYRLTAKPGQIAPQRTKVFASAKEAKLFKNEMEGLLLKGLAARNGRLPLADLLRESLDDGKPHLKPSTFSLYDQLVKVRITPEIGHHPIERVDQQFLSAYYTRLGTGGRKDGKIGGLSGSRINMIQTIITQALKKAVLWKYLSVDPTIGVKRQSYRAREMKCLNPTELGSLLNASENPSSRAVEQGGLSSQPIFGDLVTFMAETGCRMGEALALQWTCVDLIRGQVRFERSVSEVGRVAFYGTPKNGEGRTISIKRQPRLVEKIRALHVRQAASKLKLGKGYEHSDNLVFCWPNGEALHGGTFAHAFAALVKRTSIPRIRLHDLRHTHASILIYAGASVLEVSRRLGHKTVSVTLDTYAHLLPAQDEASSGAFALAMEPGRKTARRNGVVRPVVPAFAG